LKADIGSNGILLIDPKEKKGAKRKKRGSLKSRAAKKQKTTKNQSPETKKEALDSSEVTPPKEVVKLRRSKRHKVMHVTK
jgi:hypothetical protein